MALNIPSATLDLQLDALGNVATRAVLCTTEPANYAAVAGVTLCSYTIDSTDFTKAAGDVSGRKITLSQQTGNTASASGTGAHLALTNGTNTLYGVWTVTSQSVTSGNPVTINAVDLMEIRSYVAE